MVQHFHLFFFILALILYPSLVHAGKQRGGLLLEPVSCLVCSQHPLPCPPGTSILASCLMEKMGGEGQRQKSSPHSQQTPLGYILLVFPSVRPTPPLASASHPLFPCAQTPPFMRHPSLSWIFSLCVYHSQHVLSWF